MRMPTKMEMDSAHTIEAPKTNGWEVNEHGESVCLNVCHGFVEAEHDWHLEIAWNWNMISCQGK